MRLLTERPGAEVAGEVALGTREAWEDVLDDLTSTASAAPAPGEPDAAAPEGAAGRIPVQRGPRGGHALEVHLDLADLTFVDASGAASLCRAARRLAPDGRLVLHDAPPALCRVLDLLWPEERTLVVCPK
ncbi:hypothetical protein BIV57_17380 [Mangrovactinospora gilvigrisea]|uniref:STAS domain-containing protein n=1 Tax=Mangrovactinospora gilvigrisea TaxID=1428644 RepID=A0A1J7BC33_9ACTN|nr:STAS domain-containing protein [Mangrovactinospora gilvigrisea]OIV36227.1 hypothetical protein BIV57_17380 [Mangrovactinospora gilvigrisea]